MIEKKGIIMEYSEKLLALISRMNIGEKKILERVDKFGWEDWKVKEWESHLVILINECNKEYIKIN